MYARRTNHSITWGIAFALFLSACVRAGASPLAPLQNPKGASLIEIHSDWMGLSEFGPVGRRFVLKPAAGGYEGTATFSLGGGDSKKTKDVPITVPAEAARAFLSLLAGSPLQKGAYKPFLDHTDDYPSVTMDVTAGGARFSFYSTSQGNDAIPWGADIGGEKYTINSKAPMDAFRKLEPYFKETELANFMEAVRTRK
jgi:hypothetical protein